MQHNIFDFLYPKYKITKPIRLTELFAGYGSQALALKYLNIPFEHNAICEWAVNSIIAYKELHFPEDNTNYSKPYTYDQLKDLLVNYGISQDYNKPMTKEQIARKNESWCRKVYNSIIATHNLVDVSKAHLEFDPTYCNILTYSFPCQDLSLAGKMEGMHVGTRSGLLWEVERILSECKSKPDILLMENVPQVHSARNIEDFNKWQLSLEKLGYKNYFEDLNAKDYGVPQNRNRCFMISILGDYSYSFPQKQELKLKLKDLLDTEVDERFYLSQKIINCFMSDGTGRYPRRERFLQNIGRENQDVGNSVTTLAGNRPTDNFVLEYGNKALNETLKNNQVEDGDFIDAYNKKVKKDVAGTITTRVSESNNTFIAEKLLKEELCDELIEKGLVKEGDVVRHSYSNARLKELERRVENTENPTISPTLTTRPDTLGVVVPAIPIKNATKKGYLLAEDGDGVDISGRMEYHRGTVQKGLAQTITTAGGSNVGVVVAAAQRGRENGQQIEISDREVANAITTVQKDSLVTNNLRIRKLTPRECYRLMGVDDSDYDKVAKNQSEASLYHLAGDSIVVDVLAAIFKELL